MGWDPRFATGANASVLSAPGAESNYFPSSKGLAEINPREKKDRRWAQDVPGVNKVAPGEGKDWERKQRAREYRVAARREKRNRKADEKKQRKLNATILRRMTRNPEKYNKNAERNRLRSVQLERQAVWLLAVKQAERLAIEHDPSGKLFNVSPVTRLGDGTVISVEALQRREENRARREAEKAAKEEAATNALQPSADSVVKPPTAMDPQRYLQMEIDKKNPRRSGVSKTQQRKLEALQPKTEPPRPILPSHITLPEGEENFIALWDLTDTELERRVLREKRRKAAERKALRLKQQAGKAERRLARDEKRALYRRIKETWKAIKEETSREKTRLKAQEEEESKKIAIEVNEAERARAMELCASLGFTLENTEGVSDIKPKALGMKGQEVDFDAIEPSDKAGTIRLKDPSLIQQQQKPKTPKRVDLGGISGNARPLIPHARKHNHLKAEDEASTNGADFLKLDIGPDNDDSNHHHQALSYNRRLRRKLRRALDNCLIAQETLVREACIAHLHKTSPDTPIPPILKTAYKPINTRGARILESGALETAKQERVRARVELAEFNKYMKVLRRQAKQKAIEAGLRKHAEATGRIAVVRGEDEGGREREGEGERWYREVQFNNGPARIVGDDYGLGGDSDVEMVDAGPLEDSD